MEHQQPFAPTPKLILALGHAACRLLHRFSEKNPAPAAFYLPVLSRKTQHRLEDSWRERLSKETADTLQQIASPATVIFPSSLLRRAAAAGHVILLAGLGRHTGSTGLVALAYKLVRADIPTEILCSTPFSCEGRTQAGIADSALNALPPDLPAKIIQLEAVGKAGRYPRSIPDFLQADQHLLQELEQLVQQKIPDQTPDAATWAARLRVLNSGEGSVKIKHPGPDFQAGRFSTKK